MEKQYIILAIVDTTKRPMVVEQFITICEQEEVAISRVKSAFPNSQILKTTYYYIIR